MLPNLVCIGTYRAGTTWLYKTLKTHPDIFLPDEKELMFFSHHYDRGISWYAKHYEGYGGQKWVGDICPTYLSCPAVAERMHKYLPEARLVVSLRNPVDQIWSLYNLWRTRNSTNLDFETALRTKAELLENVLYYKHILQFLEYYDAENMLILYYEDLSADPRLFLGKLYHFLAIDEHYPDLIHQVANESRKPKYMLIENMISGIGRFLRRKGYLRFKATLNRMGISEAVKRLNTVKGKKTRMPDDLQAFINEYVAEDKQKLQQLTNRDLSFWK